ncbi:hypothetical protein DSL72_001695 [Monilinia vaccinii-corymbosi]|uniref:Uncharacterized protein n=1 Tax=Monilinia vaccinii-corymbosi TaxID=61207 RepID=A0A8A3P7S1_9HELO|nr:hypothetical protein DSL72_001695 [Monilinia vaccinii-corymbosi]
MDCKVPIRKYALVSRPSNWAQKGDRVVSQPQVQNITNKSVIPMRRFSGNDENSICFMPIQDIIEKDRSIASRGARVTSRAALIDAHSVALFKGNSNFDYGPGDKFRLFITANRTGYKNDAPLINLRTMKTRSVPVPYVPWLPKMRGPDNKIWAFGGSIRKQTLSNLKDDDSLILTQSSLH